MKVAGVSSKIMIVRHGEKPGHPVSAIGINAAGETDPLSLTATGWQRARALVRIFNPRSGTPPEGLAVPQHLFAANDHGGDSSRRPIETLTPLAHSFDPSLDIDASIHATDTAAIAEASAQAGGVVLVAWKHEEILEIAARLVSRSALPGEWPGDRFDMVFVFDRNAGGSYEFSQIPERALPGDRTDLFT
jgi:hypothetical protein